MYTRNGEPFDISVVQVIGDLQYPIGYFFSKEARDAFEVVEASDEPLPSVLVPAQVTRRQARRALLLAGLLDQVQPAIDAIPDATARELMRIDWEDAQTFDRTWPTLIQLATAIGVDSAGLDQLFIQASQM